MVMREGRWWSWPAAGWLAAGLLALLILIAARPAPLASIQAVGFDALQGVVPEVDVRSPVAVVLIREPSLRRVGPWPWPRREVAALVERIAETGATRVVLPIVFNGPDRHGGENDLALAAALGAHPSIVGTLLDDGAPADAPLAPPLETLEISGTVEIGQADFAGVLTAIPSLRGAAMSEGAVNLLPEPDMVVRRVPTVFFVQAEPHPAISLAAALPDGASALVKASSGRLSGIEIGEREIRTDGLGRVWLDFARRTAIPVLEASSLDEAAALDLAGRTVILGIDAAGLSPTWRLADGSLASGPEVLGVATDALILGNTLSRPDILPSLEIVALALAGLALISGWLLLGPLPALGVSAGLCLAWGATAVGLRFGPGLVLDALLPVLAMTALTLAGASTRAVAHWHARLLLIDRLERKTRALEQTNTELQDEIAARRRAEVWLSQASRLAGLGYYLCDVQTGRCEICSAEHAAIHGLTPQAYIERVGARALAMPLVVPEDRDWVLAKQRNLLAGKVTQAEYRVMGPGGHRRLREIAKPLLDADERVEKILATTFDVTDQRALEDRLARAEKMESIGRLSSGIAHDFNNLLAVILGNLELVRTDPDPDRNEHYIEQAIAATFRGRELSEKLLSFGRRAYLRPEPIDLNLVVGEIMPMIRRTTPDDVEIETKLAPKLPTTSLDRSLLESALLNLAINARDAMPGGGTITIVTQTEVVQAPPNGEPSDGLPPGLYVCISVSDTGHGIAAENIDTVREPFFSTKSPASGSGLGLSMVDGFAHQSGGDLMIESTVGKGTTMQLLFPAMESASVPSRPVATTPIPQPFDPKARVLLVEDNAAVREVLATVLKREGLAAVTADSGARALRLMEEDGPFDLLLADVVLPGELSGLELAQKLRANDPALAVILISANPIEALPTGTDFVCLTKPVPALMLVKTIEDLLATRGTGA